MSPYNNNDASIEDYENYIITEEAFDEWIDEVEERPTICGISICPSEALKKCDPIAYATEKINHEDYLQRDGFFDPDVEDEDDNPEWDDFGHHKMMREDFPDDFS